MSENLIAFDGDDTLWDNQIYYDAAEAEAKRLFSDFLDPEDFGAEMLKIESRRVGIVGFGAASFSLSIIELATKVVPSKAVGELVPKLIKLGEDIVTAPYTPIEGAGDAVEFARSKSKVILITKGSPFEQRQKFHRNGFVDLFDVIEIVHDKKLENYSEVARRNNFDLADMCMIGNSIKSDIRPLIGHARKLIHIPYHTTWAFEASELDAEESKFVTRLQSIKELGSHL